MMERKDKEQLKRRLQVLFFCVEKVISLTQETNLLWGSFSSCILTGVKWVIEEGKLDTLKDVDSRVLTRMLRTDGRKEGR
jgi:hypothetical protein